MAALIDQSATASVRGLRNGDLSSVDLIAETFALTDSLEPELNAWVHLDRSGASSRARLLAEALARGEAGGSLAGVTAGIKDIFDVEGMPTKAGAAEFAHSLPAQDSTVVARLRDAGVIVLGKTATTQFAYLDPAPTRNPWNVEHTPGGSSSGSAAAVASRMCQVAIGSQTVGSVLRPAAYCGVVGLKPTYGRISKAGVLPLATSLDHTGIFARSVADVALVLQCVAGYDPGDNRSADEPVPAFGPDVPSSPPTLGLLPAYYEGVANEEVAGHMDVLAERFAAAGASVQEVVLPFAPADIVAVSSVVHAYEAAGHHREWFAAHAAEYGTNIRRLVETGMAIPEAEYERARARQAELRAAVSQALRGLDCLMLPVAPSTAPKGFASTGDPVLCALASTTGLPTVSLPSGLGDGGLPLAVQLVAGAFDEPRLLSVAAWVEALLAFRDRPPILDRFLQGESA